MMTDPMRLDSSGAFAHGLPSLLAVQGLTLLGWWYPIILAVLVGGWAWVVATVFDKDTARFYLPRQQWNAIHMVAAVLAVAIVVVAPLPGFITLPIAAAILGADLIAYAMMRNGDKRVPEAFKWTLDLSKLRAASDAKKKAKNAASAGMVFKGPGGEVPVPQRETPEYEVRVASEALIQKMVDVRGSQLDVTPTRDGNYGAVVMVDGVRQPLEQMPANRAVPIIDFLKRAAGLDVADRRRKLTGEFKLGPSGVGATTPVRVTTQGASSGMQLSLLLDPEGQVKRRTDDLGLLPNQVSDLGTIVGERTGLVLVVAPPDGGRTSLLYALVRAHDAYTSNVQTIEVEPQGSIEGVRLNRFDPKAEGAEYSTLVRSILRRDPNVVAIAEMPDEATAKEVAKADLERTRVYLAFGAESALSALQIFAKAVGDQRQAAQGLHGVIAARLMRKLCENCRVAFQPAPDMLKKLGLPPDTKQLFRKGGQVMVRDKPQVCTICGGSGFFGQIGVYEVYPIGAAEREMVEAMDLTALKGAFRQKKQHSLMQAAMLQAIQGLTSVDEVARVLQPAQETKKPAPAGAAAALSTPKPPTKA